MEYRFRARDYRRVDDREERQLYWCPKCNYGRLAGDITPEEVASFYPDAYYTHGTEPKRDSKLGFSDRLRAHLAWRLDFGTPLLPSEITPVHGGRMTFCDLGCGSGEQLRQFKEAGYEVVGVEPDPRARSIAQKVGVVLDGTAENIPPKIAGMRFDLILLSHVLEHCIDPMKALSNVRKILASDGSLVIEVPNNSALGFCAFRALWPWTDIPRHLNFFTERSLRAALQMSGFAVTRVNYVGYARQFHPDWIRTQEDIWARIGTGSKPNFKWAAWALLYRTAFASDAAKYDSVRVHAVRSCYKLAGQDFGGDDAPLFFAR
jgi:SAM-dependent methyltransferase